MVFLDPIVKKKLTIDYGDRQLTYRTTDDYYSFDFLLAVSKGDTLWITTHDGYYESEVCSFNDETDQFHKRYLSYPTDTLQDTLMWIKYENFDFTIE